MARNWCFYFVEDLQCSVNTQTYDKLAKNNVAQNKQYQNAKNKLGWGKSNIPGNTCATVHNHTHTALTVAAGGAARLQC